MTLLIALLVPSIGRARDQAKAVACKSNLRQFALGWTTCAMDNRGGLCYGSIRRPIPERVDGTAVTLYW